MTAYRTLVASFLALSLLAGAPAAVWGGDTDAAPCMEQSSGEAVDGCCEGDGAQSVCEMVCASGSMLPAGTHSNALLPKPTVAPDERCETAAGIARRAPDTAPPKLPS